MPAAKPLASYLRTMSPFLRGTSWSLLGIAAMGLSQWIILIVLARLGSPAVVGQYGLASAIVLPVMAVASLQLRGLQSTDARGEFAFGHYLALRTTTNIVAVVAVLLIVFGRGFESPIPQLAILLLFGQIAKFSSDIYTGLYQVRERHDLIAQSRLLQGATSVLGFTIGMWLTRDVVVSTACSTIGSGLPLWFHNIPVARRLLFEQGSVASLKPLWQRSKLLSLFVQALPLGIISLLISLQTNIPQLLLAALTSEHEVGLFVALASILTVTTSLAAPLTQVVGPRLSRLFFQDEKSQFLRVLAACEGFAILSMIMAIATAATVGPYLVSLLFSEEYGANQIAIIWIAAAGGIRLCGMFVGVAITVLRVLYLQVWTNLTVITVLAGASLVLIPDYGLTGAAAALAMASSTNLVLNSLVLGRFVVKWQARVNASPLAELDRTEGSSPSSSVDACPPGQQWHGPRQEGYS